MVRIVITGNPSFESAMKTVNERADGYVLKPFEVTELLEKIKKALTREDGRVFSHIHRGHACKREHPCLQASNLRQMVRFSQ